MNAKIYWETLIKTLDGPQTLPQYPSLGQLPVITVPSLEDTFINLARDPDIEQIRLILTQTGDSLGGGL